jgi:hypothetical protein
VSKNAPVITACEAIIVAADANNTMGTNAQEGNNQKPYQNYRTVKAFYLCSSTAL